jgi:hypothetical protein
MFGVVVEVEYSSDQRDTSSEKFRGGLQEIEWLRRESR